MLRLAKQLWNDQAGVIVSAELVLISTVGVIGLVTGLTCLRDAVNSELSDVSCAIQSLDQSYCYTGFHSYKDKCHCQTKARTAGSTNVRQPVCEVEAAPATELVPVPEHRPEQHRRPERHPRKKDHDEQDDDEQQIEGPTHHTEHGSLKEGADAATPLLPEVTPTPVTSTTETTPVDPATPSSVTTP